MKEPYTELAFAYDYILRHVDYDQWYRYLRTLIFQYMRDPGPILELGCGTGKFGAKFSKDDFEIYGMDKSVDMLRVARARAFRNFRIFCGDMTRFSLARQFDFIFSVHDTMNYFLTLRELAKVLRCVRAAMHAKSVFMFDVTTEHNILTYFDGRVTRYTIRGTEVEWSNTYDKRKKQVVSTLEFKRKGVPFAVEAHVQRIYSKKEVSALLAKEGFKVLDVYGDYTFSPPGADTVMMNFVTRRTR
ncbi:MAG: class I SAM-dependent methyltransferase [Spirochaetes bacterium]|nr:MAG: class I SAM-dependent methyltransferase [Spirochaetota bacterium]